MPKRSCSNTNIKKSKKKKTTPNENNTRSKKQRTTHNENNNVSEYTLLGPKKISLKPFGYICGNAHHAASVRMEVFLDPCCPDSKRAYPTMKAVAEHFGPSVVQLKVHLFPLPYHRNSHVITKGAHVISEFKNKTTTNSSAAVFAWLDLVYKNLDKLTPTATSKMNDGEVLDSLLAPMARAVCGIAPAAFATAVAPHTPADSAARLAWKYGCTRGVYGTPMFSVNDVFVNADPTWTLEQWVKMIQPLVEADLRC